MWRIKGRLIRFQMGMGTILGSRLKLMHVILWEKNLSILCLCPKILCEAEFKGGRLTDLMENFKAAHCSGCGMYVLLTTSILVCSENEGKQSK